MSETTSQRIRREWAAENGIGVDGFAIVWRSTYVCGTEGCEVTQEFSGCGHCGPPGALGPPGEGGPVVGLCNGGTHLCSAYREVSERRVPLEFVERRDDLWRDLVNRFEAALAETG